MGLRRQAAAAAIAAVQSGMDGLRAEPPMRLSEWADKHFKMAGESSQQKGAWESWPFQVGIMDFMSDDRIEELALMKSKRVGYTKMITAMIAYTIGHLRRNQAIWQPTDDDRDSYVKSEIDPVLDMIDAVTKAKKKSKGHQDTIKLKQYSNSALHMLGGKAARAYRRITVALAILDEWDAFDQSIEKAGDPGGLAKGRLEGAAYPKFIGGTTPRLKGLSHVERACENADGMVRNHIDCPHCGADHELMWGGKDKAYGFKWERGKPETARHVCPHCHGSITQADYLKGGQPLKGTWVCEKTGKRYGIDRVWRDNRGMPCRPPRTLGAHIWAIYSPQRSWPSIAKEHEEATVAMERGDVGPMQLFVNETRGETWEMAGERSDHHELQLRAEDYALGTVPTGGLVLTCGIDVQRTWWQMTVYAWGRGLESWVVDRVRIDGNPANDEDWDLLTTHLQKRWPQAWHGGSLGLSAISIDSSDQTQAVYNWVDKMTGLLPNLRAIKGSSIEHDAILCAPTLQDIDWKGRKKKKGVKLWKIGVDTAKDLLLGQLGIAPPTAGEPRPGYIHFSQDLPREYYEQLTAEQRILAKVAGKDTYRWVKRRPRNEETDIRNYALHAAYGLGLHKHTDQKWTQIEQAVQPSADLFSTIAPPLMPGQIQVTESTKQKRAVQAASVPPTTAAPFASPFASNEWSSRL
jgi:phage terminase large subunit GpA-like protein